MGTNIRTLSKRTHQKANSWLWRLKALEDRFKETLWWLMVGPLLLWLDNHKGSLSHFQYLPEMGGKFKLVIKQTKNTHVWTASTWGTSAKCLLLGVTGSPGHFQTGDNGRKTSSVSSCPVRPGFLLHPHSEKDMIILTIMQMTSYTWYEPSHIITSL